MLQNSGTDEEDDLQLRIRRQSIPLVRRAAGGSDVVEGNLAGQLPREVELRRGQRRQARGSWKQTSEKISSRLIWKCVLDLSLQSTLSDKVPATAVGKSDAKVQAIQSAFTSKTPSKIPNACDVAILIAQY